MENEMYPKIISFVVRFVLDSPKKGNRAEYRGVIRHVQTDQELVFTDWEEAQNFMEKFVEIRDSN